MPKALISTYKIQQKLAQIQPQENVKEMADNSRDEAKTGITIALLQTGSVLLQKRDPFCKGVYYIGIQQNKIVIKTQGTP